MSDKQSDDELRSGMYTLLTGPISYLVPPGVDEDTWIMDRIMALIQKDRREAVNQAVVEHIDRVSTNGRPLSAPPLIIRQPTPCPRCKLQDYADWTLYPHQLYNSYMPGGIGHYCFPCFCKVVVEATKDARS